MNFKPTLRVHFIRVVESYTRFLTLRWTSLLLSQTHESSKPSALVSSFLHIVTTDFPNRHSEKRSLTSQLRELSPFPTP